MKIISKDLRIMPRDLSRSMAHHQHSAGGVGQISASRLSVRRVERRGEPTTKFPTRRSQIEIASTYLIRCLHPTRARFFEISAQ